MDKKEIRSYEEALDKVLDFVDEYCDAVDECDKCIFCAFARSSRRVCIAGDVFSPRMRVALTDIDNINKFSYLGNRG